MTHPVVTKAVENTLPKTLVVVDRTTAERARSLQHRAGAYPQITEDNLVAADEIVRELTRLEREGESHRKKLVEGPLNLQRAINAAAKEFVGGCSDAARELASRIRIFQDRKAAAAREAERQARERAAAEEERRQELERKREQALEAQREREAALAARGAGELVEVPPPVVVPPVPREPAPVEIALPRELPKTSVKSRERKVLQITEPSKIPYRAVPGGEPLFKPDTAAIKRALLAGLEVPGAELVVEVETVRR